MPPKSPPCGSASGNFGLRTKRPMILSPVGGVKLRQAAESGKQIKAL